MATKFKEGTIIRGAGREGGLTGVIYFLDQTDNRVPYRVYTKEGVRDWIGASQAVVVPDQDQAWAKGVILTKSDYPTHTYVVVKDNGLVDEYTIHHGIDEVTITKPSGNFVHLRVVNGFHKLFRVNGGTAKMWPIDLPLAEAAKAACKWMSDAGIA